MSQEVPKVSRLEKILNYTFSDEGLLKEALTHSTYANEHPEEGGNNERLEFVGDAVLDLLTAKLLYLCFPNANEGDLSRRRARVVRREALAELALELGLGGELQVGVGQTNADEGINSRILADSYEALAGAVYLDGGLEAIESVFGRRLTAAVEAANEVLDFKTDLQQECHRLSRNAPEYKVVKIEGPDHSRSFTCGVWIDNEAMGEGTDSSKKGAEQIAAKIALSLLSKGFENA